MSIGDKYYHPTPNGYVYFASSDVEEMARDLCVKDGYIPDYHRLEDVEDPQWKLYREQAAMKLWSNINGD